MTKFLTSFRSFRIWATEEFGISVAQQKVCKSFYVCSMIICFQGNQSIFIVNGQSKRYIRTTVNVVTPSAVCQIEILVLGEFGCMNRLLYRPSSFWVSQINFQEFVCFGKTFWAFLRSIIPTEFESHRKIIQPT